MAYLNKVMLIGNVGKDIEVRTAGNTKVASFSIATSRRYKDNNGEQKEDTQWHNISAWGKTVDLLQQLHVGKGSRLYVEGSLANRSWTDQNGQKRYSTEVKIESFQLLDSKGNQNGSSYGNENNNAHFQHSGNDSMPEDDDEGLSF